MLDLIRSAGNLKIEREALDIIQSAGGLNLDLFQNVSVFIKKKGNVASTSKTTSPLLK